MSISSFTLGHNIILGVGSCIMGPRISQVYAHVIMGLPYKMNNNNVPSNVHVAAENEHVGNSKINVPSGAKVCCPGPMWERQLSC